MAQGPVDCLIVRQDWVDEVAKIEHADILSSKYYSLAKVMDIDSEEKLVYSHPVPATHVSTSIEYEEEVRHLLSYRRPHELTQGKVAPAKLKTEDLHSREGSITISSGLHSKFSTFFVGAGSCGRADKIEGNPDTSCSTWSVGGAFNDLPAKQKSQDNMVFDLLFVF